LQLDSPALGAANPYVEHHNHEEIEKLKYHIKELEA
jgi:hypothetical protein